ncbi:MAG: DUF4465 domain-containing protein [Alistipes sp.]|nr:DUF4465 domain-containing protein [Alistipes sp.]
MERGRADYGANGANGKDAIAPQVRINDVTKEWDLSVLGAVKKVRFNFSYSEEMGGKYGFTIPGYFAYDDVAVRFEK